MSRSLYLAALDRDNSRVLVALLLLLFLGMDAVKLHLENNTAQLNNLSAAN